MIGKPVCLHVCVFSLMVWGFLENTILGEDTAHPAWPVMEPGCRP